VKNAQKTFLTLAILPIEIISKSDIINTDD
jgi:hypothetical protein